MTTPPDAPAPATLDDALRSALDEASAIEDPDVLLALDQEFAELTQALNHINSLPQGRVRQDNIESLRAHWRARAASRDHLPPWRRRLDDALEQAIERVLLDSRDKALASGSNTAPGGLNLQLDSDAMMRHGMPVLSALLEGLQQTLNDKLQGIGHTLSVAATQAVKAVSEGTHQPSPPSQAPTQATPATPAAPAASPAPAPAPTDGAPAKPKMQVNINLQGLLGSLLQQIQPKVSQGAPPKPTNPSPPKPTTPKGPPPKKKR